MVLLVPCGTCDIEINTDPSCNRTVDPDVTLISSSGLEISMAPVAGYPDKYGPHGNMALSHQHGLRWLTLSQASARPLVTGTMGISSDSGCCRVMDPDRALSSSPDLDDNCDLGWQLRPYRSAWSWHTNMATGDSQTPGICVAFIDNTGHGHQWTSIQTLAVLGM